MAKRAASWDELSNDYRKRLIGAYRSGKATGTPHPGSNRELTAAVRRLHESGDLRAARGHPSKKPRGQAPIEAIRRAAEGQSNAADQRALARWRKSKAYPSWLPKSEADMDNATAAILSTIRPAPNRRDALGRRAGWKSITFTWAPNPNDPVTITIKPVHGYAFDVTLPNRDAAYSLLAHMRKHPEIFGGVSVDNSNYQGVIGSIKAVA